MSDIIAKLYVTKGSIEIVKEIQEELGLCYLVSYFGSEHYFMTQEECYAYILGRGFIKNIDNPYYKTELWQCSDEGTIIGVIDYNCENIMEINIIEHKSGYEVQPDNKAYDAACFLTKQEAYAYCVGKGWLLEELNPCSPWAE